MGKWIRRGLLAIVVLAVIGGFYLAMREKPVAVDVTTIASGPMEVSILQEGKTRVKDIYTIHTPIAGQMLRTRFDEGDAVKAGTSVVARILPSQSALLDPRTRDELRAAQDAAKVAVAIAEAERLKASASLEQAEDQLRRYRNLSQRDTISEMELQQAVTAVEVAKAQLNAAEATVSLRKAELKAAEARLSEPRAALLAEEEDCCIDLTAPADGVILDIYARSAQPVAIGAKIADIGDPHNLEAVVDLLSTDAVHIHAGTTAEIVDWGGDPVAATVRRVEPAAYEKVSALGISEQRVDAILDFESIPEGLGNAFRVYARLVIWQADDVKQVPIAALFRSGNDWQAFVIDGDRAVINTVEIGRMNDEVAEVTSGLEVGDQVVLHPSDTISDGSPITLRRVEAP
ncbi:efflux RND transporter periplasmic adaptor subunit [Martelella radicis]|uniref:HlyD family secretion protein n=1 Tax=Martelella radicis TaxID=1397476 RepID=A0A7W6KGX5_9HYPH|nr:HlyD family efflux transporter periplasmic adaptor subunit [Martelella radicis]MBB4121086.1 HlyD family secretion protein [Martelella radicis]